MASQEKPKQGSNLWQWILIYPAFGVALVSAVPDWMDKAVDIYFKIDTLSKGKVKKTKLAQFMSKNQECVLSPVYWVEVANETKVDGTICNETGDVWLRIQAPDQTVKYEGIDVSELMKTKHADSGFGLAGKAYAGSTVIPNASEPLGRVNVSGSFQLAQQVAVVVCQKFTNSTTLVRHLRAGDACYDEVVDTNTGFVVSKNNVNCRSSC